MLRVKDIEKSLAFYRDKLGAFCLLCHALVLLFVRMLAVLLHSSNSPPSLVCVCVCVVCCLFQIQGMSLVRRKHFSDFSLYFLAHLPPDTKYPDPDTDEVGGVASGGGG